jgi:hypothetical protein
MTKIFLCLSLSLIACFHVKSQVEKLSFGINAGLNISNKTYANNNPYHLPKCESKTGFSGFGFINVPIKGVFSIIGEAGYSQMGSTEVATGETTVQHITYYTDYLVFSILPKFTLNKTRLSFFFGPSAGVLLKSDYKVTGASDPGTTLTIGRMNYTSPDFFFVAGAEYYLSNNLGFAARFSQGLTNINKRNYGYGFYNTCITLSVNYRFMKN